MKLPIPSQMFRIVAQNLKVLLASLIFVVFIASASAQSGGASINPIASFQVFQGDDSFTYVQSNATVDAATGNSVITYGTTSGGVSTMTWLANAGTLVSWTISPPFGWTPLVLTDASGQGQPGSFAVTSSSSWNIQVLSINGHPYVCNGNYLQPASQSRYSYGPNQCLSGLTYNGATYSLMTAATDYSGRVIGTYIGGSGCCAFTGNQGLQIYFGDGTVAKYVTDPTGRSYTYLPASTGQNQLTQINGYTLLGTANTRSLPVAITSFVWNGANFNLSSVSWQGANAGDRPGLSYNFTGPGDVLQTYDANGNFQTMWVYNLDHSSYGLIVPGTTPYTYANTYGFGTCMFTAFNGISYVWQGGLLVPESPVTHFAYGGSTYQLTSSSVASDGNWVAQYQTSGPNSLTATAEYSPSTDALVKLTVNSALGGTATYVDGATVGQPGAYVWSNTSTAANLLSGVNGNTYNSSGDSDLPGTATTANGVFKISGNFMSLGSWSTNTSQSGFDLSYFDGQTSSNPASVEFTGNRPLTSWIWDVASNDGTISNAVMQLDESSRLSLYPQADPTATTPTLPAPTVVLDPNLGGTSRFDGPVRIAPQGDLQMGDFTTEPTPTPAQ